MHLKGHLEHDVFEKWMNIIQTIDERMKKEDFASSDCKPILIAYKLLNDEFDNLIKEDEEEN